MKKLLMLAAAAAAILPMTAQADTADTIANGSVTYSTTVGKTCQILGILPGAGDGVTTSTNATTAAVVFNNSVLVNQATATILAPAGQPATAVRREVVGLNAYCNFPNHIVALQSQNGGLTNQDNQTVSDGTLHKRIPYRAFIRNWGASTTDYAVLNTTGVLTSGAGNTTNGLSTTVPAQTNASSAELFVEVAPSSTPLVAGRYEDVLLIRLGAGFGS